jgi:hypothetical protein
MRGLVPVFKEQAVSLPQEAPVVHRQEDRLAYITDQKAKERALSAITWLREAWVGRAAVDPIKYAISLKVDNKVVAYINPRRKSFLISTYNADDRWVPYAIHSDDDLELAKRLMHEYVERRAR